MSAMDDIALLREYADKGSEDAFTQLVERHVGLVYSVALRRVGNPAQAEEITQAVFVILSKKAPSLGKTTVLPGWLYQTARLTANNLIRHETRRVRREQELYMQTRSDAESEAAWAQIAPLLENAMDRLGRTEREAILLRFFEDRSMKEIGQACGTTENGAKKRVNRGLEKMRSFFSRHGVVLGGAAIAEAVSAHGVKPPPAGLAASAAAAALKGGAAVSVSALALIKATLKAMAWRKIQLALAGGAVVLLGAGMFSLEFLGFGARRPQGQEFYVQGKTTRYTYDARGHEIMGKGIAEQSTFYFRGAGRQWFFRLSADTNLPGGVTELGCDGTNIYVYVPGAGGTSMDGDAVVPFHNVGSVWPGVIRSFNFHMAALWWAYGSPASFSQDGPVPDIGMWGPVNGASIVDPPTSQLILKHSTPGGPYPRVGPPAARFYLPAGAFDNTLPIAELRPEAVVTNNGIEYVTQWSLTLYKAREIMVNRDGPPEPVEKFEIVLSRFGVEPSVESFVPKISGTTDMQDYRFRVGHAAQDYLTDRWLDSGKAARKIGDDTRARAAQFAKEERERPHPGDKAPVFQAKTVSDSTVNFPGDFDGRVVLIDFWATWCGPCIESMPALPSLYEKYHAGGFEVLGVSLDGRDDSGRVREFCDAHKMPWPEIMDAATGQPPLSQKYRVGVIPQVYVIDGATGKILLQANDTSRGDFQRELERLLAARSTKSAIQ